jgi:hypothetical protein
MLFWCYVCPPLACMFMGRPFSAILASILCMFLWLPGVAYAKTCYVDYKSGSHVGNITDAIRGKPERGRAGRRARRELAAAEPALIDKAHVGAHGTKFKRR